MKINQLFIPDGKKNNPNKNLVAIRYICIHNTDNYNKTSTAKANAQWLYSGSMNSATTYSQSSWHYSVDDSSIWQSLPNEREAWHASDGTKGPGNSSSIGIETCVNFGFVAPGQSVTGIKSYEQATKEEIAEAKEKFRKTSENTAWLVASLIKQYNLTIDCIKQHHDFDTKYHKDCPYTFRHGWLGITWEDFINMVKKNLNQDIEEDEDMLSCKALTLDLKKGDKNDEVKILQAKLCQYGHYDRLKEASNSDTPCDGSFGGTTQAVLKEVQFAIGVEQTGICDEPTRKILNMNNTDLINYFEGSKVEGTSKSEIETLKNDLSQKSNYISELESKYNQAFTENSVIKAELERVTEEKDNCIFKINNILSILKE